MNELIALLPHGPPMKLVEEMIERDGERVRCRGRVPADAPTAHEGVCAAVLGLELAAQAAICLRLPQGERPPIGTKPRVGYLVRIRQAHFHVPTLPVERPLVVELERTGQQGGLNVMNLQVALEERPDQALVVGQISTFETDEELSAQPLG